jgi:hypothetical protein
LPRLAALRGCPKTFFRSFASSRVAFFAEILGNQLKLLQRPLQVLHDLRKSRLTAANCLNRQAIPACTSFAGRDVDSSTSLKKK